MKPLLARYGVSLGVMVAAVIARVALDPLLRDRFPFATLFMAVLIAAWHGGLGPSLAAAVLGAVLAAFALIPPRYSFAIEKPEDQLGILLYLAVSGGIAVLGEAMRRTRLRAEAAAADAILQREGLHATLLSIGDGVIVTDAQGKVRMLNRVAERLTGWKSPEAEGQPLAKIFRIFKEDTGEVAENPVDRVLAEGTTVGLANHTLLESRNGNRIAIDDSAAPVWQKPGKLAGVVLVFRDIAERRKHEIALKEVQQRLAAILNYSPAYIFAKDRQGRYVIANEAIAKMVDRRPEEMLGKTDADFYGPEVAAQFSRDDSAVFEKRQTITFEETFPYRGRMVTAVTVKFPLLDANGECYAVCGIATDVTGLHAAERELQRTTLLLKALSEGTPDPLFVKDREGRMIFVNPATASVIGLPADQLLGRNENEWLLSREQAEVIRANDRKVMESGEAHVVEEWLETPQGSRLFLVTKAPLRNERGEVTGVVGISRDITERRQMLIALSESEERFRKLADSMPQVVYVARPDGSLEYVNRQWEAFTGLTTATHEDLRRVVHPDDFEMFYDKWNQAQKDGLPYSAEFRLRHAGDNVYRWFLTRTAPVHDEHGRVVKWYGTSTDIDDQKRAQQELQEADRRKDEFLATLAHELRNPLAPIRNAAQLLKLSNDPDIVQQARDLIDRQVNHMVRLIDDLLDVSRITRGKLQLRRERLHLSKVIESAVETARPLVDVHRHELTVELGDHDYEIEGDFTRLSQIFANLLNNAAKYTPPGGKIRLSVSDARPGLVAVAVEDNGVGIPAESLPYVFEMFAQVDAAAKSAQGGLGIGLALVRALVTMHGGYVTVESEGPGKGSRFSVYLPARNAATLPQKPTDSAAAQPPAKGPGYCVLVVDDNKDSARSLAMILRAQGHTTFTASDGVEAIETAKAMKPDLILMDLGMPNLNGHDATRYIREQPWGKTISIYAVSGWGQEADRTRSLEAGCDGHLVKPVSPAEVYGLIRRLDGKARSGI